MSPRAAAPAPVSLAPFGALSFAYFAAIGLFNPYAPLWFQSLGFSTLAIGSMASLQAWTRVVGPYGWSWLGDHWGQGSRRATLLRIATSLCVVCALGLLVAGSPAAAATVVALLFLFNSAIVPLAEAALSQHLATADGMDVARYGRVRVWGSIGFIASVSLFGFVLQALGIETLPAFMVVMCAGMLLAAWRLPTQPALAHAAVPQGRGSIWGVLCQPVVAWFFAGVFLTVLAHTALYAFFSLYLVALGYSKGAVGVLWAISVAAEVIFFLTQGRWLARWDAPTWLVIAAGASVARFAAVAVGSGSLTVLVAAQLLHALTFAAQHAACIALLDRWFAGALRGRGQALYTTLGYGASGVIGGVIGGAVSERLGFAAVFAAAALAALASLACCWRSRALGRIAV